VVPKISYKTHQLPIFVGEITIFLWVFPWFTTAYPQVPSVFTGIDAAMAGFQRVTLGRRARLRRNQLRARPREPNAKRPPETSKTLEGLVKNGTVPL
jgi:hypothetical protein